MSLPRLLLLLLLLLAASATAVVPNRRITPQIDSDALSRWMEDDATGRQALVAAWSGTAHPLANAFRNFNASVTASRENRISETCLQDVQYALGFPGFWAYQMFDSSVKVPEGLLALSLTHLGNWEECVNVGYESSPVERFGGKMCLVGFQPAITTASKHGVDTREGVETLSAMILKLAACVPSTCDASDTQQLFRYLMDPEEVPGKYISVSVADEDCTTHERPELDTSEWVAVGLLSALGVLVVLSTAYDVLVPSFRRKTVLAAFSVVSNGKKLLAMPRGDGDQTLSSLHGIRFLSMCWVVLGHCYVVSMYVPMLNPLFVNRFKEDWYRIGLTNATLAVDTFLMLSGLLVGYLFFKQPPSKRNLNIPMYYLHRYIRLTPALAMMVLMNATLATKLGWGPLWTSLVTDIREACQKNWWSTLLYVGNYVNPEAQCVDQSWYLMVDMQLHWLSPLVLLPLARWPRVGGILLGVLCVAGIVSNFVLAYVNEFVPNALTITDPDESAKWVEKFYVPTHTRFVPYLEGMAIGYVLANQHSRREETPQLTLVSSGLAWLSAAALLLVPLMTGTEFLEVPLPSRGWTAIYNTLFRPAWAMGVGTVVYLCANDRGGPVNRLLSWWGFQFLGRLSYGAYLVHATLQVTKAAATKTPSHMADDTILAQFAGDLALSLLLAVVLSLLCETPFIVLEKELLGRSRRQNDVPRVEITPAASNPSTSVDGVLSNDPPPTDGNENVKESV